MKKNIKIKGEIKQKLFRENLGFVESIVKKYRSENHNLTELDLFCEGEIALINAVNLFDPQDNYKFSTLAVLMIRKAILKSLNEEKAIFQGCVKASPWPDFTDESTLLDYFDIRRKVWTLETMNKISGKEKIDILFDIKSDIGENMSELTDFLSEILKYSKTEAKQELKNIKKMPLQNG